MEINKEIFKAKQALAARLQSSSSSTIYAIVKSIDQDKRTCVVTINDADFADVLLYAVENTDLKGFVMIPKLDSVVLVSRIGGSNELYVSMFSEVDKILLTIGEKVKVSIDEKELTYINEKVSLKISGDKVELDADQITFNGGDNKGLVKIVELTDKVNALVESFNNHNHPGVITSVSGGSGAPAVGVPGNTQPPASKAQKLNKSDYENDKIRH